MIKNKIKVVQLKLNQHRQAGTKSDLSTQQREETKLSELSDL